jgi:hypothetical protein
LIFRSFPVDEEDVKGALLIDDLVHQCEYFGTGDNTENASLIKLLDFFSTLFFWYLFAMTGYWFIFFKL